MNRRMQRTGVPLSHPQQRSHGSIASRSDALGLSGRLRRLASIEQSFGLA
jgi:hypothetical protein